MMKEDYGEKERKLEFMISDLDCDETGDLLMHFNEVIRRHHEVLAEKDRQIRELQLTLARYRANTPQPRAREDSEEPVWTNEIHEQSDIEKEHLERANRRRCCCKSKQSNINQKSFEIKKSIETECPEKDNQMYFNEEQIGRINQSPVNKNVTGRISQLYFDETFVGRTNPESLGEEHFGKKNNTNRKSEESFESMNQYLIENEYYGSAYEKQPFKTDNSVTYENNKKTFENNQILIDKEFFERPTPSSDVIKRSKSDNHVNPSITNYETTRPLKEQIKKRLEDPQFGNRAFVHGNTTEKPTKREFQKRENLEVFRDLEHLGRQFVRRLNFEQRLDRLHWLIEKHKLPKDCAHCREFQMLETIRYNLLLATRDFKYKSISRQEEVLNDSKNTLFTLYRCSSSHQASNSDGELSSYLERVHSKYRH